MSIIWRTTSRRAYNLASEEIAAEVAVALNADKLILMGKTSHCVDTEDERISELALALVGVTRSHQNHEMQRRLDAAEHAVRSVGRCHLLGARVDGAILTGAHDNRWYWHAHRFSLRHLFDRPVLMTYRD